MMMMMMWLRPDDDIFQLQRLKAFNGDDVSVSVSKTSTRDQDRLPWRMYWQILRVRHSHESCVCVCGKLYCPCIVYCPYISHIVIMSPCLRPCILYPWSTGDSLVRCLAGSLVRCFGIIDATLTKEWYECLSKKLCVCVVEIMSLRLCCYWDYVVEIMSSWPLDIRGYNTSFIENYFKP